MHLNRLLAAAAVVVIVGAPQLALAQEAAPAAPAQPAQVAPAGDLVDTLKASGQFTTFLRGIDSTNLTSVLKTYKNLTVFAPTDAAFQSMGEADLAKLMNDKAALQKLLTHHIINAPVDSSKIKGARGPVPSVAQDQILLDGSEEGALKADGATIVQADVRATNGIVHVVDKVLVAGAGEAQAAATGESQPGSTAAGNASGTNP
ncbi:fasciclin domain-containing protein [Phenylobacterium sp.]|uniref:fasciclin domain-containing protein n=1 Tax=Phenylobacterium sp. TaxID=1871053 RepID=UPI0039194636